jgi:hypothetical protein
VNAAATDLTFRVGASWFGHARHFDNRLVNNYDGANGHNWVVREWPYAVDFTDGGSNFVSIHGFGATCRFLRSGSAGSYTYAPQPFDPDLTLSQDNTAHTYTLTNISGARVRRWVIYDNDSSNGAKAGVFKESVDSAGTTTSVTTYTSGRIDEIQRAVTDGGTTTTYSLVYSYLSSGANSGRLERVTVRKKVGAGRNYGA